MTYSISKDLDRGRVKSYDGTIHLWIKEHQLDWITLKDAKGTSLVGRRVYHKEKIDFGFKVRLPSHIALVGTCVKSPHDQDGALDHIRTIISMGSTTQDPAGLNGSDPRDPSGLNGLNGSSSSIGINVSDFENPKSDKHIALPEADYSSSVYDDSSMGLDYSHGIDFAKEIHNLFSTTVHPNRYSGHFIMVVSFARANFRLSDDSVAIALEAVIGGLS